MIFDQINNLKKYSQLPFIDDVVKFLHTENLSLLRDPEISIRHRDVFVRVMRYNPQPAEKNKFETHQKYADIQVLILGKEIMQFAPLPVLTSVTEYHEQNDYQFYAIKDSTCLTELVVLAQNFVVFFPGEAHRPSCLCDDHSGENFKLVFKIRMDS